MRTASSLIRTMIGACACGGAAVSLLAILSAQTVQEGISDPRPSARPDRIILTFAGDPSTSQAVTWRTDSSITDTYAQLAIASDDVRVFDTATLVSGATESLENRPVEGEQAYAYTANYHSIQFTNLTPGTLYAYRVGDGKASWSEWCQFRTASANAAPFSFLYLGDAQNNILSHWSRTVRAAMAKAPGARFILHAGDLVTSGSSDQQWAEWHRALGWINGTVSSVPVIGNHEYYTDTARPVEFSRNWRPQFTLPKNGLPGLEETVYFFDYQGVRFVVLNSIERVEEQAAWLDRVLTDNPNLWTVVSYHYPVYENTDDGGPRRHAFVADGKWNWSDAIRTWIPIFAKHHVDLALQGHDHMYARGEMGNTLFVTSVSGPKQYDNRPVARWLKRVAEDTQMYQVVRVDGHVLRLDAYTATGELYDAVELRKRSKDEPHELIDLAPKTPARDATTSAGVNVQPPSPVPDRIVLTAGEDMAHAQAVTWRTDTSVEQGIAQIAIATPSPRFSEAASRAIATSERLTVPAGTATAGVEEANIPSMYHHVRFEGLKPSTLYAYRVGDGRRWSEWFQFRTASAANEPFAFLFLGPGSATNPFYTRLLAARTIRAAYAAAPDARFLVQTGLVAWGEPNDSDWGDWFESLGWIAGMIPLAPMASLTEHGSDHSPPPSQSVLHPQWKAQFQLPDNGPRSPAELADTVYSFDFQGLRLCVVNTLVPKASDIQLAWLRDTLGRRAGDAHPPDWKVVAMPQLPGGDAERRRWEGLFQQLGVDLVLLGDRNGRYSRRPATPAESGGGARGAIARPVYVASASGVPNYEPRNREFVAAVATQAFVAVHVSPQTLRVQASSVTGRTLDDFVLTNRPAELSERSATRP